MANEMLAIAYDSVDSDKAERLRSCASSLTFRRYDDGSLKLDSMNSCRVRLCPMCAWRRSLRNFYNNLAIARYLDAQPHGGAWLALTLTVKSVDGENLSKTLDILFYSFNKLFKQRQVIALSRGFYRGLEVTHDCDEYITKESYTLRKRWLDSLGLDVGDKNPTFDMYHPHFHVLVHVNKSYFSDRRLYMSTSAWADAWRQALGVDYTPSVKVQRVKSFGSSGIAGSVAEISKYSVKDADYICADDWDLTVETVRVLDQALANRRLIAYGGDCRDAKKALALADADTGDLVAVSDEGDTDEGRAYTLEMYFWHTGFNQYSKTAPKLDHGNSKAAKELEKKGDL